MTISNSKVAFAWAKGQASKSKHMRTDGKKLYSYNLLIGITGEDGFKYVKNYTKCDDYNCFGHKVKGKFVSMTTSHHVALARRYGYAIPPD